MTPTGKSAIRGRARPSALEKLVRKALEDMKAVNIQVLDVRGLTDVADTMIVASGTSDRHVRSIAEHVALEAKKAGQRPLGVEGQRDGEWVLVDLRDVLLHVMLPRVREFYAIEQLWEAPQKLRKDAGQEPRKSVRGKQPPATAAPAVRRAPARKRPAAAGARRKSVSAGRKPRAP